MAHSSRHRCNTFSNRGISLVSRLGHCSLNPLAKALRKESKNLLFHRFALCKCSEHIIICIEIHCWWLRQDRRFEMCQSRLDFVRLTRRLRCRGLVGRVWIAEFGGLQIIHYHRLFFLRSSSKLPKLS
jgi:hypothetical protein